MQRFEITVDDAAQETDYATQAEADAAAKAAMQANAGKTVSVRPKAPDPNVVTSTSNPAEQGTPGNPAGSPQR